MKKIEAFIRHEAFEPIRMELLDKGFPSISIAEYKGSGRQKGDHRALPGLGADDPSAAEAEAGDRRRRPDAGMVKEVILQARPHRRGRRRQDLRPAGRGGDPHPDGRGGRGGASGPRGGGDPGGVYPRSHGPRAREAPPAA